MTITPFFLDLRSAYLSELDDLTFDSEGKNVLRQRLADKRREIGFLVRMMEISPEMVAVVLHGGFAFTQAAAMDDLLGRESDEFPDWHELAKTLEIAPWASALVDVLVKEPQGEWFLTVAAALEYLAGKPGLVAARDHDDDDGSDSDQDHDHEDEFDDEGHEGGAGDAKSRKEAADDWMAEQGFDRKD